MAACGGGVTPPEGLLEFLLARIAEDKAWIAGDGGSWLEECQECGFGGQPESPYSRARLLAECEMKRRFVEVAARAWARSQEDDPLPEGREWLLGQREGLRQALALLTLPYVDHPDCRPEWRL